MDTGARSATAAGIRLQSGKLSKKMKSFKVITTTYYYKIVSSQMDTGVCSATAVGIRLPRYTPGKQTKGWAEGPSQLSVWKKSPKVSSDAVCRKAFLSPSCLPIKCLCCSNPRPYDPKLCIVRGCTCNVIPALPTKLLTACF